MAASVGRGFARARKSSLRERAELWEAHEPPLLPTEVSDTLDIPGESRVLNGR